MGEKLQKKSKVIKVMQEFFYLTIPNWWVFLLLKKSVSRAGFTLFPEGIRYTFCQIHLFSMETAKLISIANPIKLQVLGGNLYDKCVFLIYSNRTRRSA